MNIMLAVVALVLSGIAFEAEGIPRGVDRGEVRKQDAEAPPSEMTAVQAAVVKKATMYAEAASASAEVEALFDQKEVRDFMSENCPSIAQWSSEDLAVGIEAEMRAAELVSNFEARGGALDSFSLREVQEYDYWPTQWEMIFLDRSKSNCSDFDIQQAAEEDLYGFPSFHNSTCLPNTFTEAANRPVYTALNSLRVDCGNPGFGDVAIVWKKNGFADEAGIIADRDTGIWEFECDPDHAHPQDFWLDRPNCSAGPPGPDFGSLNHFSHLFERSHAFYNDTNWIGLQACRMLSTEPWGLEAPFPPSVTLEYWEVVVAKTAFLDPPRVRFIIASFASLFGHRDLGDRLRRVCRRKGWVLVFAFGDALYASNYYDDAPNPKPYNRRLIDPTTLTNTTFLSQQAQQAPLISTDTYTTRHEISTFQKHWQMAERARPWKNTTEWHNAFDALAADLSISAHLAPLTASDNCPHLEECIGTVPTLQSGQRLCLCYTSVSRVLQ